MSEPIKAGDLVQIVHQCCASDSEIGELSTVASVYFGGCLCVACGFIFDGILAVLEDGEQIHGIPTAWLKRIPPLGELDDVKRDEKITA